jgi:hypothetical protein
VALAKPRSPERFHARTYLVSIVKLSIGPNDYVHAYSIETFGVTMLAACRLPPGWTVTVGSSADPSGTISGEASLRVTYLDRTRLKYLHSLALIELTGPVKKRPIHSKSVDLPETFRGKANVGKYGSDTDGEDREIQIAAKNIKLTPATRCPNPHWVGEPKVR